MTDVISFAGKVETEGRRIRGSVVLKGSRTARNGEYVEVDPAALVKADASDVFALLNHDPAAVLGRTRNGTLSLSRTEDGIAFETADLPNTQAANDALELARGGYFGGSSFAIEGLRSKFDYAEDGTRIRRITSIKRLVDVSPVYDPAFTNSSAAAFSKESDVSDDPIKEAPETEAPPAKREPAKFKQGGETADSPKSGKDDWQAFAADLPTEVITGQMDAIFGESKGDLKGDALDRYEGFAAELQVRKRREAADRARIEAMQFAHNARLGRVPKAPEADEMFASDDYKAAFNQYLRSDQRNLERNAANMEQFAQTIAGDGSQGGFTVPDGFLNRITQRLKDYGGIAEAATEITTSTGESLRWPYIDDTANKAVIAAEDTQAASGADLVFDSIELGAFEYDATGASGNPIEVSLPLLQDSAFDIESLLADLLGKRIGRKQADHWAVGAGGTEPLGLLTKSADTMTATVASLAAAEHILQVDSAYRNSGDARWVMSDTTLAKLWTAQATTNEPLFMPGRTLNGKPFDTIYGYPVTIDPSAGNLVAFGDIKAGYVIRRVRGVQLLVDPYVPMVRRAVRYHAWARADGTIQDPNAYSVSSWAGVSADT
jgi:HK97 family phage major capsid protein/HK97 family phage prohead protease